MALYKWIIAKARLIVIDNLFSGTDILMRNSVREFLNLQRAGESVLYTVPLTSELSSVCDRLYELAEGRFPVSSTYRQPSLFFCIFFVFYIIKRHVIKNSSLKSKLIYV